MKLVTSLTLLAALLAAAPAARAADDPCAADLTLCSAPRPLPQISATPASPRVGSPVVLDALYTGRGSTLAWDLDGDGQYDDAAGAKATTTFSGGTPLVGVRETDQFGRTGSETLTLTTHTFNASPSGSIEFSTPTARVGRPMTVTARGFDPDGQIAKVELDLDGDPGYEAAGPERVTTFDTPGIKTVRARFTDDAGAVATASATLDVHAANLAPRVSLQLAQADGSFTIGAPLVAGGAIVTAYGNDADGKIAGFDFDLDGNGSYEAHVAPGDDTPSGIRAAAPTSFAAGEHEVGVRVTDSDGGMATARESVLAVPQWPVTGTHPPSLVLMFGGTVAQRGVPTTLYASSLDGGDFAWDTDDDGVFDDGVGSELDYTFPAVGEYTVRVKATEAGRERIGMATVSVREPSALPPVLTLFLPQVPRVGAPASFDAWAASLDGGSAGIDLTFDMNGDGSFDDDPSVQSGYVWTFGGQTEVAVTATDGEGRSATRTGTVSPIAATDNLGPVAQWLAMPVGFPSPDAMGQPVFLAGHAADLEAFANDPDDLGGGLEFAWDLDGDGQFDDGASDSIQHVFSAGEHTVALQATDSDGASSVSSRTFTVGTHVPKASFSVSGSTVSSTSTDEDGDALSIEWDLDGDRAFDDATGPSARALEGTHLVGVKATDPSGEIGITYMNVTGESLPLPCACDPGGRVVQPGAPPAKPPLTLTVVLGRTPKLAALLKNGLSLTLRCSASCRTTAVATVDKKTMKKLHLRSRTVGRGIGFGAAVRLKLNSGAKRALKRVKSVKLTLTMTALGSDGLGAAASRTLTVKR